jgi:beta-lactam-binding protein with PASTA domain
MHRSQAEGQKPKAARKALLKAECKLGKVKGKKSKPAKVKTQNPKPETVLTAGSKVNVTLK